MRRVIHPFIDALAHSRRLLEEGTHDSLLTADGEYATLWRKQAQTYAGQPQG